MSRIGKIPVEVPKEVKVNIESSKVNLEGPKGKLSIDLPSGIKVELKDNRLVINRASDLKQNRANHGTIRSRLATMIEGVTKGHKRSLEIQGVGLRAQIVGNKVTLNLGFSHPIEYEAPKEVKVTITTQTQIIVEGPDAQLVGMVAAKIKDFKPVEPYKGKGIRFVGEIVKRKQGKSVTK